MDAAVDGELPFLQRLFYKLHVALCPGCKRTHRSLCNTLSALHGMRDQMPVMDDDEPTKL